MHNLFRILFFSIVHFIACNSPSEKATEIEKETITKNNKTNDKEIVCFVYHRFGDSRYPSTNISLKDFEAHLKYLKNNNYQVLSLSGAIEYLNSDFEKRKTAVITIDDGYKSFFKNGLPLLNSYSYPATLFVNTETVGGGDYMNWEEIKGSMNQGVEIGNHTHSHEYFLNLPAQSRYKAFEDEIGLSQKLIEENTNFTPKVFAYPYGELDLKMKEIVNEFGFVAAAAQNSGVIYSNTDLMQLPRFPMSEAYAEIEKFTSKANMKPLKLISVNPESFIVPSNQHKPSLEITFDASDLVLDQLQCFIQGSTCQITMNEQNNGKLVLSISPETAIENRRRTLYTITVPDKDGNWHWFSHLYIDVNKP